MLPYIGNNDYRGYLNFKAQSGDANAATLLNYVGNDGNFQNGQQFMAPLGSAVNDANARFYQEFTAGKVAGVNTGGSGTTAPSGGGTAPAAPILNQAAIDNTNKALASLDTELNTGYKNIDDSYNSVVGNYDVEAGRVRKDFDEQTVTNNQNLQKNQQSAMQAAARGRRGLYGTLASMGALSGDGQKLADEAVVSTANEDLGGASETYQTNATSLTKAFTNFEDEDRRRRAEAETARNNSRTSIEGSIASKRQNMFQKMAEIYGEAGDQNNATTYMNRAGDLNEEIASKSAVQATPITARNAAFTPEAMKQYLAGAGDMSVRVAPSESSGVGPSRIIAGKKKREDEFSVV